MSEPLDDGSIDFSLGMDGWKSPDRIQPNQYAAGVNVSTRGGKLRPRPSVELQSDLSFDNTSISTSFRHSRSIEDIWRSAKFQAGLTYKQGSESYIICVMSGLVYKINVRTQKVTLLSDEIKTSQYTSRINWSYAADKVLLFDWPDRPIIIDGDEVRRSKEEDFEVPISLLGAYNHNRTFVGNAGVEFEAGDPVGNPETPNAPLTFIETLTPSSEFYNQTPSLGVEETIYPITAMGFLQEQDSSTGIGPMFVSTEEKLYFARTNQPRSQWTAQQFTGVLLANVGVAGARAFVNVNSDLIFMGSDGQIYALSNARNEAQRWGNVSLSREVSKYVKFSDKTLTRFAVLGYANNCIYISVNPYRTVALDRNQQMVTDYAHGGLVVMELTNLNSFLSEGSPTWAGLWTGINPVEMLKVDRELYIFSKDGCGGVSHNALYKLTDEAFDRVDNKRKRPIRSIVYTRDYDFKNKYQPKKENTVSLSLDSLKGKISLDIEHKPAHGTTWEKMAHWEHEAVSELEGIPSDEFINGVSEQNLKPLVFSSPAETYHPITGESLSVFNSMQYRLTIEGGYWELDSIKAHATAEPFVERQEPAQSHLKIAAVPLQPEPDWICPI